MNGAISNVNDMVFPGAKQLISLANDVDAAQSNDASALLHTKMYQEIVSSLPLQVLLYFHWRFSVLWAITHMTLMHQKSLYVSEFENSLTGVTFTIWCFIETFRIYFGYKGNLKEQVYLTKYPFTYVVFFVVLFDWFQSCSRKQTIHYIFYCIVLFQFV